MLFGPHYADLAASSGRKIAKASLATLALHADDISSVLPSCMAIARGLLQRCGIARPLRTVPNRVVANIQALQGPHLRRGLLAASVFAATAVALNLRRLNGSRDSATAEERGSGTFRKMFTIGSSARSQTELVRHLQEEQRLADDRVRCTA